MASTSVRSITAQRDDVVASGRSPAYQAYQVLHIAFVVAPVIAGLDKFADLLTNWDKYLAPAIADIVPFRAHAFMMLIGIVEIAAGLVVAIKPRIGAYVVAAWLVAIIIDLLMVGGYLDVALRDLGLCLGALALARLSIDFDPMQGERASHG